MKKIIACFLTLITLFATNIMPVSMSASVYAAVSSESVLNDKSETKGTKKSKTKYLIVALISWYTIWTIHGINWGHNGTILGKYESILQGTIDIITYPIEMAVSPIIGPGFFIGHAIHHLRYFGRFISPLN